MMPTPQTVSPTEEDRKRRPPQAPGDWTALRPLALPLILAAALGAFGLVQIRQQSLSRSLLIASAALAMWNALLFVSAIRNKRTVTLEIVLRKQHYLQACAQASVLLYWGWYLAPGL